MNATYSVMNATQSVMNATWAEFNVYEKLAKIVCFLYLFVINIRNYSCQMCLAFVNDCMLQAGFLI